MQYSQETIEKLVAIAEEKGEYVAVSNYLGISQSQLLTKRRQYSELDIALKKAIKRHLAKRTMPDDYKFSVEELEDITATVKEYNVDQAGKKYGLAAGAFFNMRKSNPALDAAIIKGQKLRKENTPLNKAIKLFKTFDADKFKEVTEVAENGGLEAVEKKYDCSPHILTKSRKQFPELEEAIRAGLSKRPIGAAVASANTVNKERKAPKPYKKKDKLRKPPREIVDKTMLTIEENSASALENFRKMIEERKARDHLKRARKGDYSDMIGL